MKTLITILVIAASITGYSQCQAPQMQYTVPVQEQLINSTIQNSSLVIGNGQVGGGVSYTNPMLLRFKYVKTTDNDYYPYLHAVSPINLTYGAKLWFEGETYASTISMAGSDTIYIADNTTTHIYGINPNNGGNVIMLGQNAQVSIGYNYTYYHVGDTIKTSNNPTNFIYLIQCPASIPLNLGIQEFYEYSGALYWVVSDNTKPVTVEYWDGKTSWSFVTETREMSLKIDRTGYYRIKQGSEYSGVIKVTVKEIVNMDSGSGNKKGFFDGRTLILFKK